MNVKEYIVNLFKKHDLERKDLVFRLNSITRNRTKRKAWKYLKNKNDTIIK